MSYILGFFLNFHLQIILDFQRKKMLACFSCINWNIMWTEYIQIKVFVKVLQIFFEKFPTISYVIMLLKHINI